MSFKFNFDLEDEEEEQDISIPRPGVGSGSTSHIPLTRGSDEVEVDQRCYTVTLDELLDTLPPCISYSPLSLSPLSQPILRRDLHDARFQLASTSTILPPLTALSHPHTKPERSPIKGDQGDGGESYVSAGAGTDLIPGLYEGGLKTWEGGVDLVHVLKGVEGVGVGVGEWVRGRGVMEVGCGTALPSAYILSQLLAPDNNSGDPPLQSSTPSTISPDALSSPPPTTLLLQDYNLPVLTLVTLPNLLLASLPYLPVEVLNTSDDATDIESVLPDLTVPGELDITPQVKESFKGLLKAKGVELEFRYGAWKGLAEEIKLGRRGKWGLVMSAETIYARESVNDLIDVLRSATAVEPNVLVGKSRVSEVDDKGAVKVGGEAEVEVETGLEESLAGMDVRDNWDKTPLREGGSVILIAAKVLYFGVGGGLQDFLHIVESQGGWWSLVKEWTAGVGRKVVRIGWP